MANQKNKLPTSVIVLNIIMIIIVLVICGLLISLLYGDQLKPEAQPTVEASSSASEVAETLEGTAEVAAAATTTTTKATTSVSMTKRTTEPTEPVYTPEVSEPTEEADTTAEYTEMSYDKAFFENDLFIGDSITTGLHLFGRLDMKNVAADTGYTPYKAYNEAIPMYDGTSKTALEYAQQMQPKRIFIMLGSNGLAAAGAMEDSYRMLIEKLNAACPDTVLYCISVTPLAKGSTYESTSGITNDKVVDFNSFIKSVCSDNGIKYIDLYSMVTGADGYFLDDYAEVDGMHFKAVTYDLMLSYIQSEIS